jgi:hypothetical protein
MGAGRWRGSPVCGRSAKGGLHRGGGRRRGLGHRDGRRPAPLLGQAQPRLGNTLGADRNGLLGGGGQFSRGTLGRLLEGYLLDRGRYVQRQLLRQTQDRRAAAHRAARQRRV